MLNNQELLNFTVTVVREAVESFKEEIEFNALKEYDFQFKLNKEIKAKADIFLEEKLISKLGTLDIPILSEEGGMIGEDCNSDYLFIVDPLDGTFNFVKNFGPYAISVALWENDTPIFGVIYDFQNKKLFWGGANFGSFCDSDNIVVSSITDIEKSLICSGFPVRYDLNKLHHDNYIRILSQFAKVRMIGSAAISLTLVARGLAEAYFEKNIMIWDIAAGLAISQGAGACYELRKTKLEYSFDVLVSNEIVLEKMKVI